MARRADIAKRRWISWAEAWACHASGTPAERAEYGMWRTAREAEHGGTGIGPGTYRRAKREWSAWHMEVQAALEAADMAALVKRTVEVAP